MKSNNLNGLFSYHFSSNGIGYKIFNKSNYAKYFDYSGTKEVKNINRSTIEGLFRFMYISNITLKNNGSNASFRSVYMSQSCWAYTYSCSGMSNDPCVGYTTQCYYTISSDLSSSSQYWEVADPGGHNTEVLENEQWQSPNAFSNQNIIDSLQGYPCAQSLLAKLPSLNNDLAAKIKSVFSDSKDFNITFVARNNMGNVGGETLTNAGSATYWESKIALNAANLQSATQEYILATMYHEAVHAYLGYEHAQLGSTAFDAKYPKIKNYEITSANGKKTRKFDLLDDHERFVSFISQMKSAVLSFNPSLPADVLEALVRMGIVDPSAMTNQQKLLNDYEKDASTGNSKGTKCPAN